MKVIAVIQARMGSTRLPGKSLLPLAGAPLIRMVIERVKQAKTLDAVFLATSVNPENDALCSIADQAGIHWYRGSEENVLSRFIETGKANNADIIVRICADNPLVDADEIDRAVLWHIKTGADYTFNNIPSSMNGYPDGLGAEVVSAAILYGLEQKPLSDADCEHVTQYIIDHPEEYRIEEFAAPYGIVGPEIKLDIDTPEDYSRMKNFIEQLPHDDAFSWNGPEIVKSYRKFFHSTIVIIFEKPEHVIQCPDVLLSQDPEIIKIATSPGACWELEKRGITYSSIEKYYDNEEFYRAGLKNYQIVEEICSRIDARLNDIHPCIRRFGIKAGTDNFVEIKMLFDLLMWICGIIDTIIKKEKPGLLISFSQPPEQQPATGRSPSINITDQENAFGEVIGNLDWNCKKITLPVHVLKSDDAKSVFIKPVAQSVRLNLLQISRQFPTAKNILYCLKRVGFIKTVGIIPSAAMACIAPGKKIGILNFGYDWNYLIPHFYLGGYYIDNLETTSFKTQSISGTPASFCDQNEKNILLKKEIYQRITGELFSHECTFTSGDVTKIFCNRIRDNLYLNIIEIDDTCNRIIEYFSQRSMDMILCAPKTTFLDQVLARIARSKGVPVLCYQHGAVGHHFAPIMLYQERSNTDYHFVWGNGVKEYIDTSEIQAGECETCAVGSYELEEMREKNKKKLVSEYQILYLTSAYYHNQLYVSHPLPRQDNDFWVTQQKILKLLCASRVPVAVKLHPSEMQTYHIYEFIQKLRFRSIKVIRNEKTTPEIINTADVIVVDWPTTTLLQVLTTNKPVFVLLKHIVLTNKAIALLKKRAYCSDDPEILMEMVKKYLSAQETGEKPDTMNNEFLDEYGTMENNIGSVPDRVMAQILRISPVN